MSINIWQELVSNMDTASILKCLCFIASDGTLLLNYIFASSIASIEFPQIQSVGRTLFLTFVNILDNK